MTVTVQVVAWVDSDSLVVSSLRPLLAQADRLPEPGSARPGPRIGASYDSVWWDEETYPVFSLAVYNRTFPCMKPTILMP